MKKVSEKAALAAMKLLREETTAYNRLKEDMDEEIKELKEQYQEPMVGCETIIEKSRETINAYITQNRDSLFTDSKTTVLGGSKVSIRKNPAKVQYIKGWDLGKTLTKLKKKFADNIGAYLKVKEDIDKSALKKLPPKVLKAVGLEVVQTESIKIEFDK